MKAMKLEMKAMKAMKLSVALALTFITKSFSVSMSSLQVEGSLYMKNSCDDSISVSLLWVTDLYTAEWWSPYVARATSPQKDLPLPGSPTSPITGIPWLSALICVKYRLIKAAAGKNVNMN